ncbi:hypothetical protein KY284_029496 [Solanum tuberosum]|nr:hypothetical protein KY284_029496 [Solanum tuberosum]
MLDSLNEIDLVAFYTSSDAPSPSKMSTISPVNIGETSPLNPYSPLDLNNPAPEPGPCFAMLSNHLFKGDLPENKSSESNILAASESLVVESLTQMRGGLLSEKGGHFVDDLHGALNHVYPSSYSIDTDEDNRSFQWIVQKKMVPVSIKGKEVSEETPKRRPFTRFDSKKLMGDAMKSSITTTAERRKKRKSGVGKSSEAKMEKQVKKPGKGKSKAYVAKRFVSKKGKNKRKREISPVIKPASGMGPGPMGSEDDHEESKQSIVNNLRLQKVLGGRVFDPDIITKHRMNSLYDLVEIQSCTHLLQTKSPVLHEEEVREFYYNIEFEEDGSINTRAELLKAQTEGLGTEEVKELKK